MEYKDSNLVLEVSKNVNPAVWDEGFFQNFFDLLFGKRSYQKEAAETALRFLNSGEYQNIKALAKENFEKNEVIRARWNNDFSTMEDDLDLADKLSATLDLATGTGKSYVMFAIALVMLATKKVSRVLVLVPSITIESECIGKVYSKNDCDRNDWTIYGEPDTRVVITEPKTVELTCAAIVNRIPDVINAKSGFVPTSQLGDLEYKSKPLNEYVK